MPLDAMRTWPSWSEQKLFKCQLDANLHFQRHRPAHISPAPGRREQSSQARARSHTSVLPSSSGGSGAKQHDDQGKQLLHVDACLN